MPDRAVEALILRADRAWLLHLRGSRCRDEVGLLEGFGGRCDPAETPPRALDREVREELGPHAHTTLRAALPVKHVTAGDPPRTWEIHPFVLAWHGGELIAEPGKNDGFRWVHFADWHTGDPARVADGLLSASARLSVLALRAWIAGAPPEPTLQRNER